MENQETLRTCQLEMLDILQEFCRICEKHNLKYWLDAGTLLGSIRHRGFIPWDDDIDVGMLREDYEKFLEVAENELQEQYLIQKPFSNVNAFTKIRKKNTLMLERYDANYHQGIFLDIFPMDTYSKNNFKFKLFERRYHLMYKLILFKEHSLKESGLSIKNLIKSCIKLPLLLVGALNRENLDKYIKMNSKRIIEETKKNTPFRVAYGVEIYVFPEVHRYEDIFPLSTAEFEGVEFTIPHNYDSYLKDCYGDTYMELPPEGQRIWHNEKILLNLTEEEEEEFNIKNDFAKLK
ncbi:lipopolysaccharide cholinephosphotransferase [Clostridium collagenovorans DSM 3089]|uniref:Lipopolysaccharide cholinephosphotransferase n=1 Tax=Clostridium collagenovorans DSM 3089 TaxID=1121306 RepID=A0A1M5YJ67_9CLOT|nr:LicD family protein [Clostridium collagenovorans]SHI12061.1 lipopolysaccharide cholinephosphotransferase [Clostridium collagenovorans DSM 3089]